MNNHKFIITSDSTGDLPDTYVKAHDMEKARMIYTLDGVDYDASDCNEETSKRFYDLLRTGVLPKTSMVNPNQYRELFLKHIEQGRDILHMGLSSTLSPSINGAKLVAEELMEEYPERKIIVIDSLGASLGLGALIYFAIGMQEEGETLEDTGNYIKSLVPKLCHYFIVDDLFHLKRSGRISKASALVGTMLSVKPVMNIAEDGGLKPIDKIRGRKQAIDYIIKKYEEKGKDEENEIIFICHADCAEDASYIEDSMKKLYGIKNFFISNIGPIIGNHAGPGTLAIFFIGDSR